MENSLIEYITKLNSNIEKIENNEKIQLENKTILPLLQYLRVNNNSSLSQTEEFIKNNSNNVEKLRFYKFTDFINFSDNIENYLSELTEKIHSYLPENADLQSIDFLLYEILINIYKHSKFKNAYIKINNHKNGENFDICVIDDGIGIPGSFSEASIPYKTDCESIYAAINGKTTDKEKYNLHGRGLNSSVRITTLGFKGEILIASGEGICLINENGVETYLN